MSILTFLFGQKPIAGTAHVPYEYSTEHFRAVESITSIPELIRSMGDYSGYIRQASIARAVRLGQPKLLPAIAARLNDWVPQVRDAARSALITLLPVMPQDALLAILPTISNLRSAGRHDHAAWLEPFERDLFSRIERGVLADGVHSDDIKLARACFDLLLRFSSQDVASVIQVGLSSSDIVTGLRAAHAIAGLAPDQREPACKAAMLSRFGAVRAIGLRRFLNDTASPAKHATAMACLLDAQSSVRAIAIAWLAAHQVNVREHYHQVLASPGSSARHLRIGLVALGALRQRDDAGLVSSFVTHQVVIVRAAAYAAWLKLAESDKDLIAARALGDDAECVKKLATQMVARHGAFIAFATACSLLGRRQDWPRLMRLGGNGKWDAIEATARIAPAADPVTFAGLRAELESSLTAATGYHRPTAAQAAFLRSDEAIGVLETLAGPGYVIRDVIERELSLALSKRR